ncbi:DUF6207 family protein [Streptomyces olivaceus]|uniref:DUF6207 family protein n=1 Tax=Streptomyces olivaceus TaxID=47716 RepID=UPI00368ACCDA
MEAINDMHVSQPGLVVVDVAAADDETAFAFHTKLAARWATTSVERTTRDAGQPGVRLRCYLDLRQPINASGQASAPHWTGRPNPGTRLPVLGSGYSRPAVVGSRTAGAGMTSPPTRAAHSANA